MNNSSLNWGNGSSGTSPSSNMEPNGGWNKAVLDVWHCGDMTANSPPSLIHHAHRWSTSYCGFNISMWRKSKKVHSALNTNVFSPPTGTKLPQSEKKTQNKLPRVVLINYTCVLVWRTNRDRKHVISPMLPRWKVNSEKLNAHTRAHRLGRVS